MTICKMSGLLIGIGVVILIVASIFVGIALAGGDSSNGKPVDHYLGSTYNGHQIFRLIVPLHGRHVECIEVDRYREAGVSCNWQEYNRQ